MHCIIKPESLVFNINVRKITKKDIVRINIDHHFSYDDIRMKLVDGRIVRTTLENHSIDVKEDDYISIYSFAKIQTIIIGKKERILYGKARSKKTSLYTEIYFKKL